MSDDIEDLLSRMKPSGVGPEVRTRVLEAVSAELAASPGKTTACLHPDGHRFVCERCGTVETPSSRARRWVMAASLTAMTSLAATLLFVVVADRQTQTADRGRQTVASTATSGIQQAPVAGTPRKPVSGHTGFPQSAPDGRDDDSLSLSLATARRPNGRRIPSAADLVLLDDRMIQTDHLPRDDLPSSFDVESNDARLRIGTLLNSMRDASATDYPSVEPIHQQATDLPGRRS